MALPATTKMQVANGKTIEIPSVGFGTWASGEISWCKDATLAALKAGYRHLDCAWKYGGISFSARPPDQQVDHAVGAAIRESGIPRSEIFITTKFWPHFAAPENVSRCLQLVLDDMGLEYVDLYLAHWPVAFKALPAAALSTAHARPGASHAELGIAVGEDGREVVDLRHSARNIAAAGGDTHGSFVPTWRAMQRLVRTGKTRAVGVSNFSIVQLQELLDAGHAGDRDGNEDVPLSCNQVEAHPWLPNDPLLDFMRSQGIVAAVYSPFAGQKADGATLLKDSRVVQIAEKNGMGVGQVLQSWAVMRGTVPLGKSQNEGTLGAVQQAAFVRPRLQRHFLNMLLIWHFGVVDRIKANLAVKRLPEEDFEALSALRLNGDEGRTIDYSDDWGVKLFV
ncbi:MAG: hypothetical protein M1825_002655 [Sarcosagium campestre]|nr:MAG: hypothetical protein M1825_002655 [Sarcosagium campestre]